MKKFFGRLLLVIVLVGLLGAFMPHRVLKAGADVQCRMVEVNGERIVLPEEQAAELLEILSSLYCYRVWGEDKAYLDDRICEIYLQIDQEPLYVVLGKRRSYCYSSYEMLRQFDILNGAEAKKKIAELLQSGGA